MKATQLGETEYCVSNDDGHCCLEANLLDGTLYITQYSPDETVWTIEIDDDTPLTVSIVGDKYEYVHIKTSAKYMRCLHLE